MVTAFTRGGPPHMNYEKFLASRTNRMEASAIREILKVVSRPGMVSLAGGIPAPESFPIEIIQDLTSLVVGRYGSAAFQYDLTEGFPPLREALVGHLAAKGVTADREEILISSGSQGSLDGLGMILISKGDRIAVEAPTYLGAIQAFKPYEPDFMSMDADDDGLLPESLENTLESGEIKFIYLVPTFQNPTGRTIPLERRRQIAEIIIRHDALLIEDDPYSDLRYHGKAVPTIKSMAPENVAYVGTLSKIFAPGLRIGYIVAPELIRHWLVLSKQGVDLHTSTFNQALAAEYLASGHLASHLPNIIRLYKPRQEAMLYAMDRYFPRSFQWSRPEGGMFLWAEGPKGFDVGPIYQEAVNRNVAFVPGRYFYADEADGLHTMRLNFTMSDEETIQRAVRTLAGIVKDNL